MVAERQRSADETTTAKVASRTAAKAMPRACEKLEDYDVKEMIWKADLEDDGSADHEQETINETDAYGDSTIDLPEFLAIDGGESEEDFHRRGTC